MTLANLGVQGIEKRARNISLEGCTAHHLFDQTADSGCSDGDGSGGELDAGDGDFQQTLEDLHSERNVGLEVLSEYRPENPTGHYVLDLSDRHERATAVRVFELGRVQVMRVRDRVLEQGELRVYLLTARYTVR